MGHFYFGDFPPKWINIQPALTLSCIDEERGIERGSIGQSVAAIIASLPEAKTILACVHQDQSLPAYTRECAGIIIGNGEERGESLGSDWYLQVVRILRGR